MAGETMKKKRKERRRRDGCDRERTDGLEKESEREHQERKSAVGQSYGMSEEMEGGGRQARGAKRIRWTEGEKEECNGLGRDYKKDRMGKAERGLGLASITQAKFPLGSPRGSAFACRLGPEWAPLVLAMGIQGMELFAIGVVIILFMAVLKQFGILEPMSTFEGKGSPGPLSWL
ncbi:hypothetical protein LDENG_00155930 [Lucifuga dentata]|nr:hypothetical protein LDENG_00155930 [Lucifuga dentata]